MTLTPNIEKPTGLPVPLELITLHEAASFVTQLVTDPEFLETRVSPLLVRAEQKEG